MDNIKPKNIKKNYIYNLSYQIFLLIVPILVTPYIARVLGSEQTGKYSFSLSIITYFTLFASLGFSIYGQRLIAKTNSDKYSQSKCFWEVIISRLIPVIGSIFVFLILTLNNVFGDYTALMWIMLLNIIAIAFDITFYFNGNEEFGKIVIRNFIIKTLSIVSIFVFVKDVSDLNIYVLIQSLTIIISNISLWLYLPKILTKIKLSDLKPLRHLGPTFLLFLPTIATSIYTSLDKTLIGVITGSDSENGNYQYAEQIVKLSMTVFTSLGAVMIPRNSKAVARGDYEALNKNIYTTARFVMLLGIPMCIGLFCVADNFIPWYLGDGYDKAANLMKILCPIILIIGMSNVIGLQYLIPRGFDKKFTIAITVGAITNLILNLILISRLASYGAAIGTVIAEVIVTFIMYLFTRKYLQYKIVLKNTIKYIIAGGVMFIPCFYLSIYLESSIINNLAIFLTGILTYGILLLFLKDKLVYDFFSMCKSKYMQLKQKK